MSARAPIAPKVALLDVNLLIALFDPNHVHHDLAHDWFADHHTDGWATCPVTENGFVRILANPAYGAGVSRPTELVARLRRFCSTTHHVFWPASASLADSGIFEPSYIRGHRQLTDVYLLGVATTMGGCLTTFDGSIPLAAVVGAARANLAVVTADGSGFSRTFSPDLLARPQDQRRTPRRRRALLITDKELSVMAALAAGASFTPSPAIATRRPSAWSC